MIERTPEEGAALELLMKTALGDTGQCGRVARFLLSWHSAESGWNPSDLWNLDKKLADAILTVLPMIRRNQGCYPPEYGYSQYIDRIWELWKPRKGRRRG